MKADLIIQDHKALLPDDLIAINSIECFCDTKVEQPVYFARGADVMFTSNVTRAEIDYISINDDKVKKCVATLKILVPHLDDRVYVEAMMQGNIDYFDDHGKMYDMRKHDIFMDRALRFLFGKKKTKDLFRQ